jgi:hypothetical protein
MEFYSFYSNEISSIKLFKVSLKKIKETVYIF